MISEEPNQPFRFNQIIQCIQDFESQNDAKCYATATRLENFIYGTPLTDEARFLKIKLQKRVIKALWLEASKIAEKNNESEISPEHLKPFAEKILRFTEEESGSIIINPASGENILLKEVDYRHYSSIAYALRAILSIQQELYFDNSQNCLPLSSDAMHEIRKLIDIYSLAVLQDADIQSRLKNEYEIVESRLQQSWNDIFSKCTGRNFEEEFPEKALAKKSETGNGDVFRSILDQKINSYMSYNNVNENYYFYLFITNIQKYYARYYLPPSGLTLPEALGMATKQYLKEILQIAENESELSNDQYIRVDNIHKAVHAVAPFKVNDLEDVIFFPNLSQEKQVVLESFDLDSFRDFGMHWKLIRTIMNNDESMFKIELDPFAAELLAESVAQFSLLIFRIAGQLASEDSKHPFMMNIHLKAAAKEVKRLSNLNQQSNQNVKTAGAIQSSGAVSGIVSEDQFMTDITNQIEINFEHRSADWLNRYRRSMGVSGPTFSGGGVAAGDINGDGLEDLLFVGGIGNALYANRGNGKFEDITRAAGIVKMGKDGLPGEARQPIIADFDNDGLQDIFISYVNDTHHLFKNLGNERFENVSALSGLGGNDLVAGCAITFDYDRDGLLDLYICSFGDYLGKNRVIIEKSKNLLTENVYAKLPLLEKNSTTGGPNKLFRNLGNMKFEDVTEGSGAAGSGWTQAVSHTDIDNDGWQDIVVANDFGKNALYRNLGNGKFENISESSRFDQAYHSMNVGLADLNKDDFTDIYISNIVVMVKDDQYYFPNENTSVQFNSGSLADMQYVQRNILYMSKSDEEQLTKFQISNEFERGEWSTGWAWDADFFDFDNDGDDDVYVLNGNNEYFIYNSKIHGVSNDGTKEGNFRIGNHNNEVNVFFVNDDGIMKNYTNKSGANFETNSRSAVYLDYDQDGDLDIAINNFHSKASFLNNNLNNDKFNWIRVKLVGDPEQKSNRDAIGARIIAQTDDGKKIWREVRGGSGFLSMEPKTQHIGLGASKKVNLKINWPNGLEETYEITKLNKLYEIKQGSKFALSMNSTK